MMQRTSEGQQPYRTLSQSGEPYRYARPDRPNRELAEETGLTATLGSVLGVFTRWFTKEESTAGEAGHVGAIVFDAIDMQGELRATFGAAPPMGFGGSISRRS
jgi:hypothetical protein